MTDLDTRLWVATRYPGLGVEALERATKLRSAGLSPKSTIAPGRSE